MRGARCGESSSRRPGREAGICVEQEGLYQGQRGERKINRPVGREIPEAADSVEPAWGRETRGEGDPAKAGAAARARCSRSDAPQKRMEKRRGRSLGDVPHGCAAGARRPRWSAVERIPVERARWELEPLRLAHPGSWSRDRTSGKACVFCRKNNGVRGCSPLGNSSCPTRACPPQRSWCYGADGVLMAQDCTLRACRGGWSEAEFRAECDLCREIGGMRRQWQPRILDG